MYAGSEAYSACVGILSSQQPTPDSRRCLPPTLDLSPLLKDTDLKSDRPQSKSELCYLPALRSCTRYLISINFSILLRKIQLVLNIKHYIHNALVWFHSHNRCSVNGSRCFISHVFQSVVVLQFSNLIILINCHGMSVIDLKASPTHDWIIFCKYH